MRLVLIILAVLLIFFQFRLFQELREVRGLRLLVVEQQQENERLESRNDALAAEVEDLRAGVEAIEERARSELGLIRMNEEFFMVVDHGSVDPGDFVLRPDPDQDDAEEDDPESADQGD